MVKKLKKQRNILFAKVTIILFTVFVVFSAAYCAIILFNTQNSVEKLEITDFTQLQYTISSGTESINNIYFFDLNSTGFLLYKGTDGKESHKHFRVTDLDKNEVIADTADRIGIKFNAKFDEENYNVLIGFIDHNRLLDALGKEQIDKIKSLIKTRHDDEKGIELICTKYYLSYREFIPIELQVVLVDKDDPNPVPEKIIETYTLEKNIINNKKVYENPDSMINIIPLDFLEGTSYNPDYIDLFSDIDSVRTSSVRYLSPFECVIYASSVLYTNTINYNDDEYDLKPDMLKSEPGFFLMQYAVDVNLIEESSTDLKLGISIIFLFFLTIAVILCLMIWKMVKSQIIQEQKRIDLTNALAHDIKTPLFVISGYGYILKEDIDSNEREIYIDRIIEQTDKINDLVHKMLDLSKLDSCDVVLECVDFNLYDLVSEIINDYKTLPDNKSFELSHSGNNTVNADIGLIKTVIRNLVENAVKYSLDSGIIKISVDDKELCISNPCEAITKSEIKQLWEPYVRKDKSRHQKGNGLGLSIVKSALELQNIKYEMNMKDGNMVFIARF